MNKYIIRQCITLNVPADKQQQAEEMAERYFNGEKVEGVEVVDIDLLCYGVLLKREQLCAEEGFERIVEHWRAHKDEC